MLIRVLVSPRYAPTLILGRLIVRNRAPEYVGARQKKFAWVNCPGEVCEAGARQEIQRTSPVQLVILLGLVAYVALVAVLFHGRFGVGRHPLFGG
jgi:hypothetical protein